MDELFDFIVWACATAMIVSMTMIVASLAGAIIYGIWHLITK